MKSYISLYQPLQQAAANSRSYCVAVRSARNWIMCIA